MWQHSVISVDRSGYMTSYLNGSQQATVDISALANNDYSNSEPLIFGGSNYNSNFTVSMNMTAVYDYALSASKAQNLYNTWISTGN